MACKRTDRIHRYYDGELSPAERQAEETHLRDCGECRRMLADLRRLSSLISGASLAEMPPEILARLQTCPHAARDRGILRVAGWLTAAAAGVLIGALLTWPVDRVDSAARPAIWETVAVMPPTEAREDAGSDLVAMARWMANDLSPGEKR